MSERLEWQSNATTPVEDLNGMLWTGATKSKCHFPFACAGPRTNRYGSKSIDPGYRSNIGKAWNGD
jgi:hypothetical protein